MTPTSRLSDPERAVLGALCDAFHPRLTAESGDDASLFGASAGDLGVPAAAEDAFALLSGDQQAELRQFLRLLDNRVATFAIARSRSSATSMAQEDCERLLAALATSRVPQLRTGFQAVKRLSSFLFYALAHPDGTSPVWNALGYVPSTCPPARSPRVTLSTIAHPTTIDADVCVVGSGAGGGVVAAALVAKGMSVVVLEGGPGLQADEFDQREMAGMQNLYMDSGLCSSRDLGVAILAGACLGGGTAVNWQTCLRTPDDVRAQWAELSGAAMFANDRFTRALDGAWSSVAASTNESFVNANNAPIQRGCEALGYSWAPLNRNSRGCDATQCGYCTFGCRIGGKQSTTVTFLHDAQQHGDCRIFAACSARRIMLTNGRCEGVSALARGADGSEFELTVRAPRVVVAGGGIQSPALLLRSGVSLRELGRNLFLHPTTAVAGLYPDRVEPWSGPPQTIVSNHFANLDNGYGFRMETAPTHPGLIGLVLPWMNAVDHRRLMQRSPHASAIIALTRDSVGGRVRVRRDGSAVVDYVPGKAECGRIARGIAEASRVHLAAGALEVHTLHTRAMSYRAATPRIAGTRQRDVDDFCDRVLAARVDRNWSLIASAHQMGTCRIGRDARSAVCDERGEVFGAKNVFVADASAFPASSGVNPMITVMALATCVAEGIDR